jgi:hypothetical protein
MPVIPRTPRVLDTIGHCGTSVILEEMADNLQSKIIPTESITKQEKAGNIRQDASPGVHPMNIFTTAACSKVSYRTSRWQSQEQLSMALKETKLLIAT